ncbi:SLATT domain-containing protein [Amycolatopsis sp. NBC_01307]|uniref:SLATT domain-containing protein n=1 Tax=Amycolatopsis sp. NBC_01307 TaxID=2903561 RepID=UPI002E0EF612|nr:SLATT domain-containing protein [Amycolatopsis sp. NBC_01307]
MSDAERPPADGRSLLLAQVREAYGRAAYTHKTHEKQADLSSQNHRWQQRILIALTVVSSGTFLASLLGLFVDKSWAGLGTSFIALLVSAINIGTKTFKYGEETQRHRDVASKIWNLRESYQSLIVDLQSATITVDEARARRDRLQQEALDIYGDAPRTTPKAYAKAQSALKENEDLTFSTREVDLLLPMELRIMKEHGHDEGQ